MRNTSKKTLWMVQLALLAAILVIMAFTPLGYLRMPGLEITFNVIPVAVGAVVLGPVAGAILGGVFGATSFIQCFGMSPFGATLLSINPVATFVTCVIPRILEGWLTGLIFQAFHRSGRDKIGVPVANLACPLLNTLFFMSCLVLFFYKTEYIQGFVETLGAANPFIFVILFVGVNGLVEALVCFVVGTAVSFPLLKFKNRTAG